MRKIKSIDRVEIRTSGSVTLTCTLECGHRAWWFLGTPVNCNVDTFVGDEISCYCQENDEEGTA